MHEVSLCQSAVEIIEQQARQHQVKKVTGVWLEIGALSCIEESALRFVLISRAAEPWHTVVNCISCIVLLKHGVGIVVKVLMSTLTTPLALNVTVLTSKLRTVTACESKN